MIVVNDSDSSRVNTIKTFTSKINKRHSRLPMSNEEEKYSLVKAIDRMMHQSNINSNLHNIKKSKKKSKTTYH